VGFSVVASPVLTTAGNAISVTVSALADNHGDIQPNYFGTVVFTSSDGQASLPIPYAFTQADAGVHTFTNVFLDTAGLQTVSVHDQINPQFPGPPQQVQVDPASFAQFSLLVPANPVVGIAFTVTAIAQDQFGNTTASYTGQASFTCSDTL